MSKNMLIVVVVLAMLTGLWALQNRSEAAEETAPDFGDKVLLIYFKGRSADHAYTLEKVKLTELHGKKILHGVHADVGEEEDWIAGRPTDVDWDAVESITYYDDAEAYRDAIAAFADEST